MKVDVTVGRKSRSVVLEVGKDYIVQPLNVAATYNRDRRCTVVGFTDVKDGRVRVRFADTKRVGLIDPSHLVPAPE